MDIALLSRKQHIEHYIFYFFYVSFCVSFCVSFSQFLHYFARSEGKILTLRSSQESNPLNVLFCNSLRVAVRNLFDIPFLSRKQPFEHYIFCIILHVGNDFFLTFTLLSRSNLWNTLCCAQRRKCF